MQKEIYLIRGSHEETYQTFRERIFSSVDLVVKNVKTRKLSLVITEGPPPKVSVIPFGRNKISAISLVKNDREPVKEFIDLEGFSGAFLVNEELPVSYEKSWADGDPTPGVCLLTLFRRKPGINYQSFIHRWHNGHTPLTLKVHPIFHYSRNVVKEKLVDHEAWYDGIVEEHCRKRSDLMNPLKFFGNPLAMPYRMIQVYFDVRSFLDYKSVEPYLTREYVSIDQLTN